jgi:hypothetical protein
MITLENLDQIQISTYHAWSDEQWEKGNAIRAAAKTTAIFALPALRENAVKASRNESRIMRVRETQSLGRAKMDQRQLLSCRDLPDASTFCEPKIAVRARDDAQRVCTARWDRVFPH